MTIHARNVHPNRKSKEGNIYDEDSTEYENAFCGNGTVCAYLERQIEAV